MIRTIPPRAVISSNAGMSRRSPDHLMNDTSKSTESADLISFPNSWTSWGSEGEPVNRLLFARGVSGRGIPPLA